MRIAMIMVRHPPGRQSPIFPEVVERLAARGAEVAIIHPEEQALDLARVAVAHDLYVLKSVTPASSSLAGALHFMGAAILNPFPVSSALRDKIIATRVLQAAEVPVPETFVAGKTAQLEPFLANGPLILKPHRGSQGRGIRIVRDRDELLASRPDSESETGPLLAQRYHEPEGEDYKIYAIDNRFFGVRRVWPAASYEDKLGRPFALSSALDEIAHQCGRAFGIELFGIDVIKSNGRYYVVDMSSFPGFKGVPDAARLLADYLYKVGRRVLAGEPVVPGVNGP